MRGFWDTLPCRFPALPDTCSAVWCPSTDPDNEDRTARNVHQPRCFIRPRRAQPCQGPDTDVSKSLSCGETKAKVVECSRHGSASSPVRVLGSKKWWRPRSGGVFASTAPARTHADAVAT